MRGRERILRGGGLGLNESIFVVGGGVGWRELLERRGRMRKRVWWKVVVVVFRRMDETKKEGG